MHRLVSQKGKMKKRKLNINVQTGKKGEKELKMAIRSTT